jgi:ribosomal protein S18 acetylase RimI-like enzyme
MADLLVTYLEMPAPPGEAALASPMGDAVVAREQFDPEAYLGLYRAVGEPWQWDQRLCMTTESLRALLASPSTHLYILRLVSEAVGLCEFERVGEPDVELTNFGLVPEAQGRKLGPFLLDWALRSVWSHNPRRIWLHTDTNDHPKAIPTYQRAGFRIFMSRVEDL